MVPSAKGRPLYVVPEIKSDGKLEVMAGAVEGGGVGTRMVVGISDKVEFNALDDWLDVAESTTLTDPTPSCSTP